MRRLPAPRCVGGSVHVQETTGLKASEAREPVLTDDRLPQTTDTFFYTNRYQTRHTPFPNCGVLYSTVQGNFVRRLSVYPSNTFHWSGRMADEI